MGKRLERMPDRADLYADGDLGVGKTVFTQGVAAGLGIDEPIK